MTLVRLLIPALRCLGIGIGSGLNERQAGQGRNVLLRA